MESIGKFEFSRKDLIGHGAFAVVFKGRHRQRHWEVAIKCINKKNLAKSQSLLGKEIKILKELKHDNIVRLFEYQEIGGCVYLVMEYCNGGDLAEYLHSKGTLSEDTIRIFLQQIVQAMKVLQGQGILHRDLKPQNILLCHGERRRASSLNTCIKIADFGFARHLQTNTMAATLCGSPMYMAPEVLMSQNYDAKADLWSIGTIVYQCLTGKAPFYASTPQELRLFYETNRTLLPSIPKETSSNLRHLLLGLLQRNPKDRITFDEFFHHPFMKMDSSSRKSAPTVLSCPSSGSSNCGSLASHPASSPDSSGFPLTEGAEDHRNVSSFTDEYVMVPTQSPSEYTSDAESESPIASCLINSGGSLVLEVNKTTVGMTPPHSPLLSHPCTSDSKALTASSCKGNRSLPIPVPTQIHNYQRMEQNLQPAGLHGSTRVKLCCAKNSSLPSEFATGGARPQQSSPESGATPQVPEPTLPLGTRTLLLTDIKDGLLGVPSNLHKRRRTVGDLPSLRQFVPYNSSKGHIKRAISTTRLSDMLLKAAYEATVLDGGSQESLCETDMDGSPVTVFTIESPRRGSVPADTRMLPAGSPNYKSSPWISSRPLQRGNHKNSETEAMDDSPLTNVVFHPPQLPEDTLMEQSHTDSLNNLRFTLAFVHCIMELAMSKDPSLNTTSSPDVSFLEQSMLTDQISLLSREWSYASQLVLYMKAEDFLSSSLHSAKEDIKQGQLLPSATVKQVIRRLNDMYKCCVSNCRSLNDQLQNFLLDKQKLIDRFNGLTAEKIIYSHTVHMVQSAALDEMFHYGLASIQRYHKALVLMEGLSRILTEKNDIDSVEKCKQCIERRLSALHTF
ncbi:serine/threonine-protein kinase ULK1a isoform X2 [Boleophthalmus pectinirostris]|uniref:serine/threonine-protein kinase ULK1a isoform X2 n=1 Tax=Boleophthalmus pectinirostris TaxID=150288 RepID=UPI00242EF818|nr:serine/threonine-protein kinase ULK1a isoform X2 [Boleophthalmus pectinirostris]